MDPNNILFIKKEFKNTTYFKNIEEIKLIVLDYINEILISLDNDIVYKRKKQLNEFINHFIDKDKRKPTLHYILNSTSLIHEF